MRSLSLLLIAGFALILMTGDADADAIFFSDDFESDDITYTQFHRTSYTDNDFNRLESTTSTGSAYSGQYFYRYYEAGTDSYTSGADDSMITPDSCDRDGSGNNFTEDICVDLRASYGANLTYAIKWDLANGDRMEVRAATDFNSTQSDGTWTTLRTYEGTNGGWSSSDWVEEEISLSAFDGYQTWIDFRIVSNVGGGRGVLLDDLMVVGNEYVNNIAITDVTTDRFTAAKTEHSLSITVKGIGTEPQQDVTVYARITDMDGARVWPSSSDWNYYQIESELNKGDTFMIDPNSAGSTWRWGSELVPGIYSLYVKAERPDYQTVPDENPTDNAVRLTLVLGATLLNDDAWTDSSGWSGSDGNWSWNGYDGTLTSESFNVWNSQPFLVVEASYELGTATVTAQVRAGSSGAWHDIEWRNSSETSTLYAILGVEYTNLPDSWTGSSYFDNRSRQTFYADLGAVDEISDGSGLQDQYIGGPMQVRLRGVSNGGGSESFTGYNLLVMGLNSYSMDVKEITPTTQKGAPSSSTGDIIKRTYTVKVLNLGAVTDSGVVDFSITVPDNSIVTLDDGTSVKLDTILQIGNETFVAIRPLSGAWQNPSRYAEGDQIAYINEIGEITWPSGNTEFTAPTGWDIDNPSKANWNSNLDKPQQPTAGSMKDPGEILTVQVEITVGYALWAPPGTYTIQADARSWTDYDSTFTEGDPDGQASMIIDPPDFIIGDYDYISHAIGQSDEGLGWSKTSGGDEYFHFHVEVLNDGTEVVGAFKVGLLHQDLSLTDVQVSVTGAEIQTGEYIYFKATAAELGMSAGPGEYVSGTYTFYLAVDTEDVISESNENNNRQAITITAVSSQTNENLNNSGQIGFDASLNGGSYDCSSELNNYDFESADNSPTGSTMATETSGGAWIVTIVKINPQVSVNSVHWFVLDADGDVCAEGSTADIYGLFLDDDWNILFVDNDLNGKLSPGDKYEIHDFDGVHSLRIWYGPPPLSQSAVIDFITPSSAEVGTVISFEGSVANPNNNATYHYIWESSIDGEMSNETSFNTSHLSVGFHLITLLIYDSNNSWNDTATEWLIVYTRPTAIAGNDIKIKAGDVVQFLGQASDEDGNISLYEWDFDGNGIYDWSSSMTGLTEFRYSSEGTYNAVLRVTDNDGFTSTDSIVITVSKADDSGGGDDGDGNVTEEDEGGKQGSGGFEEAIPALSVITTMAAVAVIALRRRY